MKNQLASWESALEKIQSCSSLLEKIDFLEQKRNKRGDPHASPSFVIEYLRHASLEEKWVVLSIDFIGQSPIFSPDQQEKTPPKEPFLALITCLLEIETFYASIGGIIGYHITVIKEMLSDQQEEANVSDVRYRQPIPFVLQTHQDDSQAAVLDGIRFLNVLGEIYVVGGAGDRLDLREDKSGKPLPVAMLTFMGRTLLEGLIRDLQGREYLYQKCFGKEVVLPIALMTSEEKENHQHIQKIITDNNGFGRPLDHYFLFTQPLAPVITSEGNWAVKKPLTLYMKPGGHGVLWKIAREQGVFSWFKKRGVDQVLVRQINNPVAGVDNGLLFLTGIGGSKNKIFGFASCPRRLYSAEGTDVLVEKKKKENFIIPFLILNMFILPRRESPIIQEKMGMNTPCFLRIPISYLQISKP